MKKHRLAGAHHYLGSGLKPILVYVPSAIHKKLLESSKRKAQSLQHFVRHLLEERARKMS